MMRALPDRRRPTAVISTVIAAMALAAGGCTTPAATGRYPSLLPRPIESRSDDEPVAAPMVATPDPAADAMVARLHKALDDTNAQFGKSAATAERVAMAATGDAVGGERWIAAQAALADLDALRATTASALTELDDFAIGRAAEGKPPYPTLDTLRSAAQAAADAQGQRIAAIQASLPAA